MRGDEHPKHAALRSARAHTIEQLTTAFTRDELGLEEFEERLNRAYAANAVSDCEALVEDLSSETQSINVVEPDRSVTTSNALAPATQPLRAPRAVAILGSVERRGQWAVARSSGALAVLGSVVIDLRDVALPAGVTTLEVSAVLGSIEIIVPPNLAVESEGTGILGSFEGMQRVPPDADGDLPILRVLGRAVLGSIEVVTRLPDSRMPIVALSAKAAPRLGSGGG
jgi:hypothetical protein